MEILKAKRDYKTKLENKISSAWSSMRTITGLQNSESSSQVSLNGFNSDTECVNAFNHCSNRFDTFDFSHGIQKWSHILIENRYFNINQRDVH